MHWAEVDGWFLHGSFAHLYDKPFLRDFGTVFSRVFGLLQRFAKTCRKLPINKLLIKVA